jgi:DNA-binding response OmpR family regulator
VSTILVVDDDTAIVKLMSLVLRSEHFAVLEAGDGEQGLHVLHENRPDLILLDLNMPVMSGREFLPRAREEGFDGPVVVCSAYGAERAKKELGANAALEKPFDPEDLLALVDGLLHENGSK